MARRRSPEPVAHALEVDPNRITQQRRPSPRGEIRAWFKGGACYRLQIAGTVYGWGEGSSTWAAVLDGSFRPNDFGKHKRVRVGQHG